MPWSRQWDAKRLFSDFCGGLRSLCVGDSLSLLCLIPWVLLLGILREEGLLYIAMLGHGPLPPKMVLKRVGWGRGCPAGAWQSMVSTVVHYKVCIQGLEDTCMHVTSKGTGGEISAVQTWMCGISCALLTYPLRLSSQRNGWSGPLQRRVC